MRALTVDESLQMLGRYKIPVIKGKLIKRAEEAVAFAERVGYPVVLKIVSRQVVHKTDAGGLALNLDSAAQVRRAFRQMINSTKKIGASVKGILAQRMVEGGVEVIIGGKRDAQFGQTIAFGLGGLYVEVFEDLAFRIVPIKREDAGQMVKEIKGYKILKGYRGRAYDIRALVDILLKTSKLLEAHKEISELDINPVFALPKGAIAVDARIVID